MAHKDFALGNMADDLLDVTLELCGKTENKTLRFPKAFYPTYVKRMVDTALDIQEYIFEANEIRVGEKRKEAQQMAARKCVYLNHLIRIAYQRGYISEKQRVRWQKLTTAVEWVTVSWIRSDEKRES